jgi:tRNA (guanine10-N2)-methyltransferase
MMDDILDFGFTHMVDNGRLSMWMPVANDEDMEIPIPSHPAMELVAMSIQQFNKCTF